MSGATGKSEKGKTPNPTPSKKLFPSSLPPPLLQVSLLPIVSKSDPALRRSSRVSSSTGCQASGASVPAATSKKVSQILSSSSKKPSKKTANPLTDFFFPLGTSDAAGPSSLAAYEPDDVPANLSDAEDVPAPSSDVDDPQPFADEGSDVEEHPDDDLIESDEDVAHPPLPPTPPPLHPPLPPPLPPLPVPPPPPALLHPPMADAAAAAAVAAGIAAANQTASGIPPPPPFSGDTVAQCPQEWIRSLRYWLAFRNLNNAQTIAAISVLLRASALIFYQGLPDGQKDTLDHFEASFLQHYRTEGTLPWLDLAALWQCKQIPPQTVEQYLNDIARLAQRTNAEAPQVLQAALSGLAPHIRSHLVLHDIPDINDLRNKAMLAEKSVPQPAASNDVTDALKAIQQQLTAMKVNQTDDPRSTSSSQGREDQGRSRSENRENRSSNYGQSSRSPYRSSSTSDRQFGGQRNNGPPRQNFDRQSRPFTPGVQFQSRPTFQRQQPAYSGFASNSRNYPPPASGLRKASVSNSNVPWGTGQWLQSGWLWARTLWTFCIRTKQHSDR